MVNPTILNWYADAKGTASVCANVTFSNGSRIKFTLWLGKNEVYHGYAEFWRCGEYYSTSIQKVIEQPTNDLDQSKVIVQSWFNKYHYYLRNATLFNLFNDSRN